VVGINTLIENPTGDNVNVGIAFAVAVDTAKRSLDDLQSGATVSHPYLGVAGTEVTPAMADELGLSVDEGVYITFVTPGGPADEAGIQGAFASEGDAQQTQDLPAGGDVVIAIDDQPVSTIEDLAGYLDAEKEPGDTVELTIVRDGEESTVQATLDEWPTTA
jgi:S1-C subfamily serine protease